MSAIAADTWGIPGSTFALLYPVLIVVAGVVVGLGRRAVGRGPELPGRTLTPVELAFLRGGGRLAVAASLGGLRAAGALDAHARTTGTTTSKDPVELAVFSALTTARTERERTVDSLTFRAAVRSALLGVQAELVSRGLARTRGQTAQLRSWSIVLWAVVVLGVARIIAGDANGKPVGLVTFETIAAALAAMWATGVRGGPATPRGRSVVKAAREGNSHLDPTLRPSWTTYGPAGAGLSVALFGPAAILLAEPAFAHTVAAKQAAVGGGGSVGDSGGSGCAGGSSCSGGGSSCGGGGGCGGGCGG